MLENPNDEKYQVKTSMDLAAFWDRLIPAVDKFTGDAEWMLKAAEGGWNDRQKPQKPSKMRKGSQSASSLVTKRSVRNKIINN